MSKKLLLTLFTFTFLLSPIFSQGTWTKRDTLPSDSGMVQGISGFSIGNYGYAGLGDTYYAGHATSDFWQFDASTNKWTKKASFPGKARVAPACFVIGNNAYLVTGSISNGGTCVNECWEYNSTNNTWTQKANFPGGARTYAVGFAIDSLGYVGTGADELSDFYKDFYAYHPSTDTWARVANFGGIARDGDCGFAINGKGYVCFGQDSTIHYHGDMWEYDPVLNSWTQKNNIPGMAILSASGFAICNNVYVGSGYDSVGGANSSFWKYNTITDSWTQVASVPGTTAKIQGAAFAIADSGYYGFGNAPDSGQVDVNIFYKFFDGDSCNIGMGINEIQDNLTVNIYPNPASKLLTLNFEKQIDEPVNVSIMDITGREVLNSQPSAFNSQLVVDVSSLSSGMYFISMKTNDTYIVRKFIKQ